MNAPVSLKSFAKRFDRETEYFDLKEDKVKVFKEWKLFETISLIPHDMNLQHVKFGMRCAM